MSEPKDGDTATIALELKLRAFWNSDIKGGAWVLDREANLDSFRPDHPCIKAIQRDA